MTEKGIYNYLRLITPIVRCDRGFLEGKLESVSCIIKNFKLDTHLYKDTFKEANDAILQEMMAYFKREHFGRKKYQDTQ